MELREYQRESVDAVWEHLRTRKDNPCIVLPTAAGKSMVLAELCRQAVNQWKGRVLVVTHVRELVEQNAAKLKAMMPSETVGIHSAGLKKRDMVHPVIAAGIQSVYRKACDLGAFNMIVVDEAHYLPPDGDGMYLKFLKDARVINPKIRVVGLTATPFRLQSGEICTKDGILNHICHEVGIRELIEAGYLSPLVSKAGRQKADVSGLHLRGGEFIAGEMEAVMDADALVRSAVAEIVEATRERKACIIFCAGVKHGEHVVRVFREDHGIECGFVDGETSPGQRANLIARFRGDTQATSLFDAPTAPLKYLANVNVLTTGFDAPHIDCVAMLRPTMSPGLYLQQVGRGFRLAPGKADCLILDFADNVIRHGPVDTLKAGDRPKAKGTGEPPSRECPSCQRIVHASVRICPECGYEFPKPETPKHNAHASAAPVISKDRTAEPLDLEVLETMYSTHHKRNAPEGHPPSMRVSYRVGGYDEWFSEWVCPGHTGYARSKFEDWWKKRSHYPAPRTVPDAVRMAQEGCLAPTHGIRVKEDANGYDKITAWSLGDLPAMTTDGRPPNARDEGDYDAGEPVAVGYDGDLDDIPF